MAPASGPSWLTIFLDLAPEEYVDGVAFWRGVTGYAVSPARGDEGEFASLVPPSDDAHLRVRRLGAIGAQQAAEGRAWTVLRPPAGPVPCVTDRDPSRGEVAGAGTRFGRLDE